MGSKSICAKDPSGFFLPLMKVGAIGEKPEVVEEGEVEDGVETSDGFFLPGGLESFSGDLETGGTGDLFLIGVSSSSEAESEELGTVEILLFDLGVASPSEKWVESGTVDILFFLGFGVASSS